jgi:hypothetical protein
MKRMILFLRAAIRRAAKRHLVVEQVLDVERAQAPHAEARLAPRPHQGRARRHGSRHRAHLPRFLRFSAAPDRNDRICSVGGVGRRYFATLALRCDRADFFLAAPQYSNAMGRQQASEEDQAAIAAGRACVVRRTRLGALVKTVVH